MPIIESAKKRVRTTEKKTARNRAVRSTLRTAIKRFEKAVQKGDVELAKEELVKAQSTIDKSAKKGVIHKNNAARKKARLSKMYNELAENA